MEPDCKNDADYTYTEQLDANGWAFEFLRRNSDYRADFEAVYTTREQLRAQHGPFKDNKSAWCQDKRAWTYEPPIKEGEILPIPSITESRLTSVFCCPLCFNHF